jgi:hypothetical protein
LSSDLLPGGNGITYISSVGQDFKMLTPPLGFASDGCENELTAVCVGMKGQPFAATLNLSFN